MILDTDGGVDDAQALIMLVANGLVPDAVTTVFGNVGLDAGDAQHAGHAGGASGPMCPVHAGADRPLTQPVIDAKYVHGDDGLGGAPRPGKQDRPGRQRRRRRLPAPRPSRAAGAKGEKVDILMIGPLTNLALALRLEPTIIDGIGTLTIMGGNVYGRGNTTPAAEFNIYADPEAAASRASRADIDTVVVPWEPCVTHSMTGAAGRRAVRRYPGRARSKTFSQALARHARADHRAAMAAATTSSLSIRSPPPWCIDPSIVTKSIRASVDVALAPGITRGMTLVDPSGRLGTPMVTFVEEVRDATGSIALYAASIAYTSSRNLNPTQQECAMSLIRSPARPRLGLILCRQR